jgi:hypothetical protein
MRYDTVLSAGKCSEGALLYALEDHMVADEAADRIPNDIP